MLISILVPPSDHSRKQARIVHAHERELSTACSFRIDVWRFRMLRTRAKAQYLCNKYEQKRYSVS